MSIIDLATTTKKTGHGSFDKGSAILKELTFVTASVRALTDIACQGEKV